MLPASSTLVLHLYIYVYKASGDWPLCGDILAGKQSTSGDWETSSQVNNQLRQAALDVARLGVVSNELKPAL